MFKVGVVGYGYWGPNIVRNFHAEEDMEVVAVCDNCPAALSRALRAYPNLRTGKDFREITGSPEIDIVAVVTPVFTHFEIAREALLNGKHLFIEKPFTSTSQQAEELIEIAQQKKLKIMVDHTFLFSGAVRKIKELLDEGSLGRIYYYDSTRVNLGLFQSDVNVIWDLAPHDFSIMDYLLPARPIGIATHGLDNFNRRLANVAYVVVYFEDNILAHFSFNWLSPVKIRQTLIGCEHKMLVWNDLMPDEKIKIYDKGVNIDTVEGVHDLLVQYRSGDIYAPRVNHTEALKVAVAYFRECLLNDETPLNDGISGLRVVRLLEAANESLDDNGTIIDVRIP